MVFAIEDGEYWFTIGEYETESGAKKGAIRTMKKYGYTFNDNEIKNLKIR